MRALTTVVLAWTVCGTSLAAQSYPAPCDKADMSMVQIGECLDVEFAKADAELNVVYRQVMGGLSATGQASLRGNQRKWLTEREALRNAVGEGNHPSMAVLPDAIQMTKERVTYLRGLDNGSSESRPEIPAKVAFRRSMVGQGFVAQFTNFSSAPIAVSARFSNPGTQESRVFRLILPPSQIKEFGHVEGWTFDAGNRIELTSEGYRPLSLTLGGAQTSEEIIATMKSDLRNLVIAQEVFFSDNNDYAGGITDGQYVKGTEGQGRVTFTPSAGNVLAFKYGSRAGWGATITNPTLTNTLRTCGIFVGPRQNSPSPAAGYEGAPACW